MIPSSSRDVAISMRLNTRGRTAVATATGLPRYARDHKVGRQEPSPHPDIQHRCSRHAYPLCHCEEHSDVAISMRLNTRGRTAVATATGLPRYARDHKVGRQEPSPHPDIQHRCSRHAYPLCHCEEHSDVAISMRLNTRGRTAVATATGLPRYARDHKVGRQEPSPHPDIQHRCSRHAYPY